MDRSEEEGSWKDVPSKRKYINKGSVGDQYGNRSNRGNITKFYVTNLPSGSNPWEVSEFVKVFGDVAGVYITRKLDKEGRKFGFISFSNVVDVKELERALNGTKMGGFKLMVNLAKFAKENEGLCPEVVKNRESFKQNQEFRIHNNAFVNQGGGKTFRDLCNKEEVSTGGKMEEVVGKVINIPEDMFAFKEMVGLALMGRCKDLDSLRGLKPALEDAKITGVCLSYVGGLYMMLKFYDVEKCNNFLLNHACWGRWFSSLNN
ncbi:putative RNA recognition motif domain, nucleotide-binding alpha-beta plait domain superfamily [Helianthus annuus]|nr:putative RNA recognition motif domain, nucleotide-binding alpha-beta plait domain superfamily [Helianthus annuus]